MAATIQQIQEPIHAEMAIFQKKFRYFMKSDVRLLDNIMGYILKSKGKQMRPILVFLSAGLHGQIEESTYRGAALIELLHTATLVHDDVVDDADHRRSFFSINALWKNKIAVLIGDYLLSRGLLLSIDHGDFRLLQIVSQAVKEMSEGELLQIEKARKLDIDEQIYFEVIRQKTATLIAACCAVGASSAGGSPEVVEQMHTMGEKIGIAFQIKDDLLDYGSEEIGKPLAIDIKERKMTLPLIHAMGKVSWTARKKLLFKLRFQNHKPEVVEEIIAFVREQGGLSYAEARMQQYILEAKQILHTFPASSYRDSLEAYIDFAIERKR